MTEAKYPSAITSGFVLPSGVGPTELKATTFLDEATAPTVKTDLASPGIVMYFQALLPSFPAEFTTIIPLEVAISAPRVIKAVSPSKSA